MSIDFYRQLAEALRQGAVVLATVIETKGSVPKEVGTKMLVCPIEQKAQIWGTIGGAGEAKVIRQAQTVLETGEKQSLRGCLKSENGYPIRPLNPPILGDFESELARKSPRIGGLGANAGLLVLLKHPLNID